MHNLFLKKRKKETPTTPQEGDDASIDETIKTQYQNFQELLLQVKPLICLNLINLRRKKEEPKKEGAAGTGNANQTGQIIIKQTQKRITKPTGPNTPGTTNNGQQGGQRKPFTPGNDRFRKGGPKPVVAKVEPTEEEVKNQIKETLERLQGKGNKSKAAKYRRDKRDTHRQRSEDEQLQQN